MKEDLEEHTANCPLEPIHRRLEDLHRQWHQAAEGYFDPEAFRISIQTAIQTSRTVSFILQSNKKLIPDFDIWYSGWRDEFAGNSLMRWMVDARNRIEKQGDLEAHSFIKAEIVASYLQEGPVIEVPAKLSDAPLQLLRSIPASDLGDHLRKDGILRIQRRWIENTLPEYELLEAVSLAYGQLSLMLDDAHQQMELEIPKSKNIKTNEVFDKKLMKGRMPCMIGHEDARTLNIWLADGSAIEVYPKQIEVSTDDAEQVSKRYEIDPKEIFGKGEHAEQTLDSLFATASTMFQKDKYHSTIIFLLKGEKPVDIIEVAPVEHGEKYLIMRDVAHIVARKGADGVILIGEVWRAPFNEKKPYQRAVDAADKKELLVAMLVTKEGEPVQRFSEIQRNGDEINLGDAERTAGGAQYQFAPIYEVWGRKIPLEWKNYLKPAANSDS